MDFRANLDDLSTICKKIDNYNSSLLQEISNSSKIIDAIPYAWNDDGSKVFIEKYDATLKKLQTLSKAYTSITTETKNCINKYEMLDVSFANKIKRKDIGDVAVVDPSIGDYVIFNDNGQVKTAGYQDIKPDTKYTNNNTLGKNDVVVKDENGEYIFYKEVSK